jgi:hypothetical protein
MRDPVLSIRIMVRCQQLLDLIFAVSVFVIHIRTIQVILVPWLSKSSLGYALLSDNVHHYHLGLGLALAGVVFHRKLRGRLLILLAFSLALLLEEHLVVLYELGVRASYIYLSFKDNLVVYSSAVFCALLVFSVQRMLDA